MHEGRPGEQRGRRRQSRQQSAGASEDAADAGCAGNGGWKRHGSCPPVSQAARRSAVPGQRQACSEPVGERAPVRGRDSGARCPASMASMHPAPRAPGSLGVEQQQSSVARAPDALRCIQRRASLHHHELPTHSAVVVGLAGRHGTTWRPVEHRATAPAVELVRRRFAEAQVELGSVVRCRQAPRASAARWQLAGRQQAPAAGEADAVMVRSLRCSGNPEQATQQVVTVTPCVKATPDACPHRGCDVEGQAAVEVARSAHRMFWRIHARRVDSRADVRADADALDRVCCSVAASLSCRPPQQFIHQRG